MHRAEENPEFLFLFVRMLGVLMCYMFFLQNKRIFHLQKLIGHFITLWMESFWKDVELIKWSSGDVCG